MKRLLVVVMVAGCGGGGKGGDAELDCQSHDATQSAALQAYEEVADEVWEARELDGASCVAPAAAGTMCTFQGQVIDFQEDEFLEVLGGTTVKLFVDNRIDDIDVVCESLGSSAANVVCYEGTADDAGRIDFPNVECGKRFAMWAFKKSTVVPVTKPAVEYDRVVYEGDGVLDVLTISVATYNLVPGIVGFNPDPTLGTVAGRVQDCSANSIANLTAHIVASEADTPPASYCGDEPIYRVGTFYFRDNFPSADQTVTSEDGLWAFANVPVGQVTVFAYGRRAAGGLEYVVGQTKLVSLPDTITVADIIVGPADLSGLPDSVTQ